MAKWSCIFLLGVAPVVFGQQAELDRLVAESMRLRELTSTAENRQDHFVKVERPDWTNLKHLLRDWIESRLPANLQALDEQYQGLEAELRTGLLRAAVLEPDKPAAEAGYVSSVKLLRPAEFPGALVVEAGFTVPCGSDASVYVYRFTANARSRLLEEDGARENGDEVSDIRFSTPDNSGSSLLYASWFAVQCGSVWNGLDYRLFRIDADGDHAAPILSETHNFADYEERVKLTPEELLLEFPAEAMLGGFRRTYVMHYSIGADSVQRIDPVALQPQDFVHEWLIRPWSEMQSRSSDRVEKWHKFLYADHGFGEYEFAQPCAGRPGVTQIGVAFDSIGERETPEPLGVYLLVEDHGGYSYKMSEISFDRQEGCPGETAATYDNLPSLFPKK
jgi:hypothetical protein